MLARVDVRPCLVPRGLAVVSPVGTIETVGTDDVARPLGPAGADSEVTLHVTAEDPALVVTEHRGGRHASTRLLDLDDGRVLATVGPRPGTLTWIGDLGPRLWFLARGARRTELLEVDRRTGALRPLAILGGGAVEAVTLVGPHLVVRRSDRADEPVELLTTDGSFARRVRVPGGAVVRGFDGTLARNGAFFSVDVEAGPGDPGRSLRHYDAGSGTSSAWAPPTLAR